MIRACTTVQAADGVGVVHLDERRRAEIQGVVDEMAARGLRCIALAARDLNPAPDPDSDPDLDSDGSRDPGSWEEPPLEDLVLQVGGIC